MMVSFWFCNVTALKTFLFLSRLGCRCCDIFDLEQVGMEVVYMTYCDLNTEEAERRIEGAVSNGGTWEQHVMGQDLPASQSVFQVTPKHVANFVKGIAADRIRSSA